MAKLTVTTTIKAPLATVRDTRNNPDHIVHRYFTSDDRCCPRATNELRVGWIFSTRIEAKDASFWFDMNGQYNIVEPMSRISYTMGEMKEYFLDAWRTVSITFEESEGEVRVTEVFDAEEIHDLDMQQAGWQAILENFKKYVEGQAKK